MMQNYYRHVAVVTIGERQLRYPPMTIDFETRFSAAGRQTEAHIYNVSDLTVAACEKKGAEFAQGSIVAGYESFSGLCATGPITSSKLEANGVDRILTFTIADNLSVKLNHRLNLSYSGTVTSSQILSDTAADAGLVIQKYPQLVKSFTRGVNYSGRTVHQVFSDIAKETKSIFYTKNGNIVFVDPQAPATEIISLDPSTGLLDVKKSGLGYIVRSLFHHQFGYGEEVQISAAKFSGKLKLKKGKLSFNTQGGSFAEFEGGVA
jgi:hypothetical protein